MVDQTSDILDKKKIYIYILVHSGTIRRRANLYKYINDEGAFSHNIRLSEHTFQRPHFVSIVVRIANEYFSWANGHISETITHIDHHLAETKRCQNDLSLTLNQCVQFPFTHTHTRIYEKTRALINIRSSSLMTNSNEREITFASSICVYFSSSDIEVKRNERDNILEGIKQINS